MTEDRATIKVCPGGPLLVRGQFALVDADGEPLPGVGRGSVALCRCGRSQTKPLCDGSHKVGKQFDAE